MTATLEELDRLYQARGHAYFLADQARDQIQQLYSVGANIIRETDAMPQFVTVKAQEHQRARREEFEARYDKAYRELHRAQDNIDRISARINEEEWSKRRRTA